jgi:flagellar hook protein FlgE
MLNWQLKRLEGIKMLRSMYAGISGMKVNQTKLDVTGNNIANVGTTAFKGSRVRFQDMLSQSVSDATAPGRNQGGVNPKQVGIGVQVAGIDTLVTQGMLQPTSRNLDVAIDGEGYLIVGKGAFPEDNDTAVTIGGEEEGEEHIISETNGMDISYTRDGALVRDTKGNLLTSDGYRVLGYAVSSGGSDPSIDYSLIDEKGRPAVNFVNPNDEGFVAGESLVPLTIPDTVYNAEDDTTLRVTSFSIEKDGIIKAVLEDGSVTALGQIAMASFTNPAGLEKLGNNLYKNTANSGDAIVRSGVGAEELDNSDAYGDIISGCLEMSNVDLAEQFTDMIVTTRAFQAAGKTITTGDEILQDIINLKR